MTEPWVFVGDIAALCDFLSDENSGTILAADGAAAHRDSFGPALIAPCHRRSRHAKRGRLSVPGEAVARADTFIRPARDGRVKARADMSEAVALRKPLDLAQLADAIQRLLVSGEH